MVDIRDYKFISMVVPAGIPGANEKELIVSVCFNINKYCKNFITEEGGAILTAGEVKKRYSEFLNILIKFHLAPINVKFTIEGKGELSNIEQTKLPFDFFLNNQVRNKPDEKKYNEIRKILWSKLFSLKENSATAFLEIGKDIHPSSKVKIYDNSNPDQLINKNDLDSLYSFSLDKEITVRNFKENKKPDIVDKLKYINEFGTSRIKLSINEFAEFKNRVYSDEGVAAHLKSLDSANKLTLEQEEILNPVFSILKLYADYSETLEIDEIVHSFSKIADDPIFSRLMGLSIDYKLTFKNSFGENDDFKIRMEPFVFADNSDSRNEVLRLTTPIRYLKLNGKHAYIIYNEKTKSAYFDKTILKSEGVELQTVDTVSKLLKHADYQERAKSSQSVSNSDLLDDLPRGILFTHNKLDEIIKPVDIVSKDQDGNIVTQIDDVNKVELGEEHFVRGHRVYVDYQKTIFPLTTRSVKIESKKNVSIYYNGNITSCIHFDAPMAYMQNGEIKSATSNVLFEYSGELLKLKTAFAKAYNPKKIDHASDSNSNMDDDGLKKSEERWNKIIHYYTFPNRKPRKNSQAEFQCIYDIPAEFEKGETPKLRFNNAYSFIVNQEYLNGWGLPLVNEKNSDKQLTINDIIINNKSAYLPDPISFLSSENKRAPILVHKRDVNQELGKPSLLEKPSLEHLVIRSDNSDDKKQFSDERHILPPKIDIETAFWHGLLSPPNLSPSDSFDLKTRSNCPYINEKDRNSKENKKKRCPECNKMSYCGGTQLKDFYPSDSFSPPYITDPTVFGVDIKFYWEWDDDEKKGIKCIGLQDSIKFNGNAGVGTKSYLIVANGSKSESLIENHPNRNFIEFCLKKGAQLFAIFTNLLTPDGINHLTKGVWIKQFNFLLKNHKEFGIFHKDVKSLSINESNKIELLNSQILEQTNIPKVVRLTHAVKEPLITPEVIKITSTPKDHKFIEHINDWLKEKEYQRFKVGINVISNRVDKSNPEHSVIGSTFTKVELTAHFERLDAIRKIEFLKDIIPTGALELWMRKEEFIDNPEQIVLTSKSDANHIPSEPVVGFKNQENVFNLDYKIEFSNDLMSQLKNLKNIEDIDSVSDVFRSLITKLNLHYDFKTTKFEEREYFLKDISKFKGYFTDEKLNDLDKLEEYSLPKVKNVMRDLETDSKFRFKVIVLNNSQPTKPDVAFAVTTIQETRSNPSSQKTISIQKGNIVTIYLKRGRLKSGKDERVGVIVDADSLYNKLFKDNELISKAGKDIVSDRYSNRSQYLQYGDIIIPEINEYKAGFDNELGIYHFLPKFDVEKQLWKFEVELDIKTVDGKQLHNPFINFSIVHFQPFSINYNDKTADASLLELKNDCRISDVENSTWCYLLPERKLSVFFDKPSLFDAYGEVDLTVSFDHESLHHFNSAENTWKVRSNFIVSVQGSQTGEPLDWHKVGSWLDDGSKSEKDFEFYHPLLSKPLLDNEENLVKQKLKFNKWAIPNNTPHSNKYSYFRVRFIEVEWFKDETWEKLIERYKRESPYLLDNDVVDNEEMRIRFVELIY
jgi:hypothetical protein